MERAPIGALSIVMPQPPLACFYSAPPAWNPTAVDTFWSTRRFTVMPVPSWREVAAAVLEQPTPDPVPVDRYGLDPDLYGYLERLKKLPPPAKVEKPANWRAVVEDALRLARDGWAAKALALGWSVTDLYGVEPVDSYEFEGLAVWLAGRSIGMIDDRYAVVVEGNRRDVFVRGGPGHGTRPTVTPVLLWVWGR